MRHRRTGGHALTEFALLCGVLCAAWLIPWGGAPAPASRWLEAWQRWLVETIEWMAGG